VAVRLTVLGARPQPAKRVTSLTGHSPVLRRQRPLIDYRAISTAWRYLTSTAIRDQRRV
jgi:hypothetical protein